MLCRHAIACFKCPSRVIPGIGFTFVGKDALFADVRQEFHLGFVVRINPWRLRLCRVMFLIRHGATQYVLHLKQGGVLVPLSQQHFVAMLHGAKHFLAAAALFVPVVEKQGVFVLKHIQPVGCAVNQLAKGFRVWRFQTVISAPPFVVFSELYL